VACLTTLFRRCLCGMMVKIEMHRMLKEEVVVACYKIHLTGRVKKNNGGRPQNIQ
jgi:hypothetical protein